MNQLKQCEPRKIFSFFEQICSIPHGSGNTDGIADFCVNFAKKHNLRHIRDKANNVLIFKDASTGYEKAPTVILQGHLDMVCAKTPDNPVNMETDGLQIAIDGDWIHAIGTSLGGDNGIAVAMMLAILEDDTIPHPPLELVLTTDEETGMGGALALDPSPLNGRRMLNLDSEEEGVLTVSCAGGLRAEGVLPVSRLLGTGVRYTLTISGLLGGHSGVEIHKGRGNAIQLLGRVLYALRQQGEFGLISLEGGIVDNAIPLKVCAELLVSNDAVIAFEKIVQQYDAVFKAEYASTDPTVAVTWQTHETADFSVTDVQSTDRILFVLANAPCGVQVMSPDIAGLVQTSLNLGVLRLTENELHTTFSVRSSVESQKIMLKDRLTCLFEQIGGSVTCSNEYPGWSYRKDSPLRDVVVRSYRTLFEFDPKIVAIHAGLECGLFSNKLPGLDCVSLGPNMKDIHTVNERLSISSSVRTYQLILEILKNCRS